MNEQLARIQDKISRLRELDKALSLFGAQKHKYLLNPVLPMDTIRQFELKHKIRLPAGYVAFVTEIGNGGAGPFYGLEPFENALFDDLDRKRPDSLLNPGKPFVHTQAWNSDFVPTVAMEDNEAEYEKQRSDFENKYFDRQQMNGAIAICNYGCAVSLNLVVNGQAYGSIWMDDRASDNGIYPSDELGNDGNITFLNWYERWLDEALHETGNKPLVATDPVLINRQGKSPWWKIW